MRLTPRNGSSESGVGEHEAPQRLDAPEDLETGGDDDDDDAYFGNPEEDLAVSDSGVPGSGEHGT